MAAKEYNALIAIFDDRVEAEQAVADLEEAGFTHDQIGYVIRGAGDVSGGMITDAVGTKDGKGALTRAVSGGIIGGALAAAIAVMIPGIGPVLAGGILASFLGGAAAGAATGGILGAMVGLGISEDEARHYEDAFRSGRAIVAVQAGACSADAGYILRKHGGYDLHSEVQSDIATHGPLAQP